MADVIKAEIRKKITRLLGNQKEEDRLSKSLTILKKLLATSEFKTAKTILFYASFKGEVETFEIMRQAQQLGKTIVLPMTIIQEKKIIPVEVDNLGDLANSAYGVPEPRYDKSKQKQLADLDLVIVPGIAFDKKNNRLGRGAGFYDRFLRDLPPETSTIGLAFDFQIVDSLPQDTHDIAVSRVIVN